MTVLYDRHGVQRRCTGCGVSLTTENAVRHRRARDGFRSRCRRCRARDAHRYNAAHREERKAYQRGYKAVNREALAAAQRARNAANATRTACEVTKARIELHPDGYKECRLCGRRFRLLEGFYANGTRPDGAMNECRNCDDERPFSSFYTRSLPHAEEADVHECYICGDVFHEDDWLEGDHLVPASLGGSDHPANLLPVHGRGCNQSRARRPMLDVIEERLPGVLAAVASWTAVDAETGEVLGTFGEVVGV